MPTGLYLVLISPHGLIRGHDLELGRDPDTGGQTTYVVELTRALAANPGVARVDLLTRQVIDPRVHRDYAEPVEELGDNAYLVRVPCGPRRYLRKEVLWPHLYSFVDAALRHIRRVGRTPDVIHSHYADGGYVGARLSQLLGAPLVHTGHSLGRVKRQRLIDKGVRESAIESQYNMSQRIEAEEITLGNAELVIASTTQEVDEQYSQYENYHPKRMVVIPPGVDLKRFRPPGRGEKRPSYAATLDRFLHDPRKPMILALSRADERKNIATLVRAFGDHTELRERANLTIIAGNRDDIADLERGPREVLTELLLLIDRYDLYGSVAYPKHHQSDDVPDIYRIAAARQGVFINPALTEPFGLTLIEAAASGLPVVATEDGGPRDIIGNCSNGVLIDPLDADGMAATLLDAITNRSRWQRWSKSGLRGTREHYSWEGHVAKYLRELRKILRKRPRARVLTAAKSRLPSVERIVVTDIDNTLLGDARGRAALMQMIHDSAGRIGFGIATGRSLESVLKIIKEQRIPMPDLLITSAGTEIHYGHGMIEDEGWTRHIDHLWKPDALREAMRSVPGVKLQPRSEQRRFKLSYFVDAEKIPGVREIRRHLRQLDLHAKLVYSYQAYLDLVPLRASKGLALRYLALRWGLEAEDLLVAGNSGNDEEMLAGNTLGVVVGNYSPELEKLRGRTRTYFAEATHAKGVLEGIAHYNFLGKVRLPKED
jgi:sucrose-phosphate synthase